MKSKLQLIIIASLAIISLLLLLTSNKLASLKLLDYEKPQLLAEIEQNYDVIVIGGEPEGVAAAVVAARQDQKTLLVVKQEELGGLFTYGMLNYLDFTMNDKDQHVSTGIFKEWHRLVGNRTTFSIDTAKAAFFRLVDKESNIDLLTQTNVSNVIVEGHSVNGVTVTNANGTYDVYAKQIIDATQDGDIGHMAGAPYTISGQDVGIPNKNMAVTLMIHLQDVDWKGIKNVVSSEKFGSATITASSAWGFSDILKQYQPIAENTKLRGLNIAKVDNDYYINALQIFYVDGLDEQAKQQAIEIGKRETEHILTYLQQNFEGFEHAKIASYPTELYVRETRHFQTEYILQMSDIWKNATFPDAVAYGAYPVDIQAQSMHDAGYITANPDQYGIPFRSLVPLEIDNLLIVGRAAGYSSIAAGSARIVPTGFATAEAAGIAAAISNENNITVRELSQSKSLIAQLQKRLRAEGAYLKDTKSSYPYKDTWYDPAILKLMDYGLLVGGYSNDLQVDTVMTKPGFVNLLQTVVLRSYPNFDETTYKRVHQLYIEAINTESSNLTKAEVLKLLAYILQTEPDEQNLINIGILQSSYIPYINDGELTKKEAFAYLAQVFDFYKAKQAEYEASIK